MRLTICPLFCCKSTEIHIEWHSEVSIQTIVLHFDPDWDHAMESSIWGHSERVVPFTINQYQILDGSGNLIHEINANHQAINVIELSETISVKELIFRFTPPSPHVPVALFGLQIHPPQE